MADRFKSPDMDWTSPGDVHKRFKLFKQKCDLIFEGPLEDKEEAYKVRMLLLWIGDKGLEIYNTSTWAAEGDNLKLTPVFQKLEAYTKPQSNQILSRFQLRCLKQGDMTLEEFMTKARLLIEDSGYAGAVQEEMLRDTLVFGLKSDKVRKDAIAIGNDLTFQQVYNLAKTEESTRAQMKVITQSDNTSDLHAVRSKKQGNQHASRRNFKGNQVNNDQKQESTFKGHSSRFKVKINGCFRCGGDHNSKSSTCPAKDQKCNFCGKIGHFQKVCLKKRRHKLHEIQDTPDYNGEDIFLATDEEDAESTCGSIGAITSRQVLSLKQGSSHQAKSYADRIFASVKLNDSHKMKFKVDTGADTCVLTVQDFKELPFKTHLKKSNNILKNYGGGKLHNHGTIKLKLTFRKKSITAIFNVVDAVGDSSILGCRQSQELGIISLNVHQVKQTNTSTASSAADQGQLTKSIIKEEFKDCFDKIGCFPGEKYHIQLIDNPQPVIHPPRTVPVHIQPLYKEELDKMLADDIIAPVTEPTDWVNSIVCNIKETPEGKKKVRLCLDPRDLNKNVRREHYYTRTIDEILPQLHGKKHFSVVDTKKGYWHVELDHESSLLCTFNTPFGRYRFKRLPFGVIVSQDIFQRKLDQVYQGIPNVTGIADDLIIFGSTPQEHDKAFIQMMEASREGNIGLNSDKLQFKQNQVNFYGHKLTQQGIKPAEDKLQSIKDIQTPTNTMELHTILGMINYLNRFSVKLAELTAPMRELTKKNAHFKWKPHHQEALENIKQELCSAQLISYFDPDPSTETILQCDASSTGLGAWIRQIDKNNQEKIVAMASRTLTQTESRYSNIERECLAVMFGLEKFNFYLMGRHTLVETDHSPLEQIFKKNIGQAPARLQRFLLRCLKFDITVKYKPGIKIPVADALSRVCFKKNSQKKEDQGKHHEVNFITNITSPIDIRLIKTATDQDTTLNRLKKMITEGWPDFRKQCPQELWDFWNYRCDLVIEDGMILKSDRILIPEELRKQVLEALHTGHQGETKCILLARQSVFWPGISKDIINMVKDCDQCNKFQSAQPKMPIIQPDHPTRAWEKLGTDIFDFKGQKYLMIVDYYSRFPVVRNLEDMTATTICNKFSSVLAEYGLPSTIMTDFGSQYISEKFRKNCELNGITLLFSSPYHHQANSLAERAIGTCKALWKKAAENGESKDTALWMYRITPLDNKMPSPYELLFGHKPRTLLPTTRSSLQHPETEKIQEQNQERQEKQAQFYNKKTGYDRRPLNNKEPVYVWNTLKHIWEPGNIFNRPDPIREPRTYMVKMNGKLYQRTREHMRPRTRDNPDPETPAESTPVIFTPPPLLQAERQENQSPQKEKPSEPSKPSTPTRLTRRPSEAKPSFQLRSQETRSGRLTQVPSRFKDS